MSTDIRFVIHRLRRRSDTDLSLELASQELTPESDLATVLERLSVAFHSRSGRLIGQLGEDSPISPFVDKTASLLSLSKPIMEKIRDDLEPAQVADEVHLIFARWSSESRNRLLVAWLEPVEQWCLGANLQPTAVKTFGPNSLRLGLHVDFNSDHAVAVPSRPQNLGETLFGFLGFNVEADSKTTTDKLMGVFESYCQGVEDHQEASEIRQRAYDYCSERISQGEGVDLRDLSAEMREQSPDEFYQYLNSVESDFDQNVAVDARRLRQFIRFSGSMKGISISFSEFLLGEQVVYDAGTESLLIRDLPPTLKKQLKRSFSS